MKLGVEQAKEDLGRAAKIAGISAQAAEMYAKLSVDILLLGPSGVGKTFLARALARYHQAEIGSEQGRGTIQVINCAAIPPSLFEAEMFGVLKNAGSEVAARPGYVESAGSLALILDEIGELETAIQGKLLQLIQFREYRIVGSSEAKQARFHRVIAATLFPEKVRYDLHARFRLKLRIAPFTIDDPGRERVRAAAPMVVDDAAKACGCSVSAEERETLVNEFFVAWSAGEYDIRKYGLRALEAFAWNWILYRKYQVKWPDDSVDAVEERGGASLALADRRALIDELATRYAAGLAGGIPPLAQGLSPALEHPFGNLVLELAESIARQKLSERAWSFGTDREKIYQVLMGTKSSNSDLIKELYKRLTSPRNDEDD